MCSESWDSAEAFKEASVERRRAELPSTIKTLFSWSLSGDNRQRCAINSSQLSSLGSYPLVAALIKISTTTLLSFVVVGLFIIAAVSLSSVVLLSGGTYMISTAFQNYFPSLTSTQGHFRGGDEWVKGCFDLIRYIFKGIGKPAVEETNQVVTLENGILQTYIG